MILVSSNLNDSVLEDLSGVKIRIVSSRLLSYTRNKTLTISKLKDYILVSVLLWAGWRSGFFYHFTKTIGTIPERSGPQVMRPRGIESLAKDYGFALLEDYPPL